VRSELSEIKKTLRTLNSDISSITRPIQDLPAYNFKVAHREAVNYRTGDSDGTWKITDKSFSENNFKRRDGITIGLSHSFTPRPPTKNIIDNSETISSPWT